MRRIERAVTLPQAGREGGGVAEQFGLMLVAADQHEVQVREFVHGAGGGDVRPDVPRRPVGDGHKATEHEKREETLLSTFNI